MNSKLKWIAASLLTMVLLSVSAARALDEANAKVSGAAKKATSGKAAAAKAPDHVALTPADMKWGDGPPSLPAGAKLAVLEGDPGKAKAFTMVQPLMWGEVATMLWLVIMGAKERQHLDAVKS